MISCISVSYFWKICKSYQAREISAAVHISTVTTYKTLQIYSLCYVKSIFPLWTQNKCTISIVILKISLIPLIISVPLSCVTEDFIRQFTRSESHLGEEKILFYSATDKWLRSAEIFWQSILLPNKALKSTMILRNTFLWYSGVIFYFQGLIRQCRFCDNFSGLVD